MEYEEARSVVETILDQLGADVPGGLAIDDRYTMTRPYGWVFFFNSRKFMQTEHESDAIAGNGPILIMAKSGQVHHFGTSAPFRQQLEEFEQTRSIT
jgi:hypothetical protein